MSMTQILGGVALVIGLVLLGFAYHASNAPMDQVSDALTGNATRRTPPTVAAIPRIKYRQTGIEFGQGRSARRAEPAGATERA